LLLLLLLLILVQEESARNQRIPLYFVLMEKKDIFLALNIELLLAQISALTFASSINKQKNYFIIKEQRSEKYIIFIVGSKNQKKKYIFFSR